MIPRLVHEPPIFVNKFSATMLLLKKACNLIAYTYLIYIYKELRKKISTTINRHCYYYYNIPQQIGIYDTNEKVR